MTTQELPVLRWTAEEFVDAWEAGAFADRHRVQLVDGEVWDLGPIHGWHGRAVPRIVQLLAAEGVLVTTETLPMPRSMPDPDAWVLRAGAEPVGSVRGYARYDPADVLLVVEVSDATLRADLTSKAAVYAEGGVEHYWVLGRDALHVHQGPTNRGYAHVDLLAREDTVALPYASRTLPVRDLLGDPTA